MLMDDADAPWDVRCDSTRLDWTRVRACVRAGQGGFGTCRTAITRPVEDYEETETRSTETRSKQMVMKELRQGQITDHWR